VERPELHGFPYLDTLAKALALPALDAVFLARPTPTHAELASQALEAGCHAVVDSRWTLVTRFVCWPRRRIAAIRLGASGAHREAP
jgi:hypothetical protein